MLSSIWLNILHRQPEKEKLYEQYEECVNENAMVGRKNKTYKSSLLKLNDLDQKK